ncbi:MAG: redox-sensing transcriptional repressor Rex [Oscillospiraceae bacterium]|nr:redox-sensing transcriptional repressor Rex [Oscillospiraceae bacterium]
MAVKDYISNSTIRRLPRYYRFLDELKKEGIYKISSAELSRRMKLTSSQIRQDFNCYGGFGQQGYGYNVEDLRREIGAIIGVEKKIKTILIGAGNLGRAIAVNFDFESSGCKLAGIFDVDLNLENTQISGVAIKQMTKLEEFCRAENPEIAVLCIPEESAAEVCETLINCGVRAFWNFAHYDINLDFDSNDIIVENVHMGDSLLTLAYNVNNKKT